MPDVSALFHFHANIHHSTLVRFVCAISQELSNLVLFRNYHLEAFADIEPKIWEAARATSAATLFFDPITIGRFKQTFVDGGGGYNNPVQQAFKEAQMCWPDREIECIVSIGTGQSELRGFGRTLKQVGQTIIDLAMNADKQADSFAQYHPQFLPYDRERAEKRLFRFQVSHGLERVKLDEHEKIDLIATATQRYMQPSDLAEPAGYRQLKVFKKFLTKVRKQQRSESIDKTIPAELVMRPKPSTVPLEPEKIRYIERYEVELDFKPTDLHRYDYNSGTISLPTRLTSTASEYRLPQEWDRKAPPPIWTWVLSRYQDSGLGHMPTDARRQRVSVQHAVWCSDYGGAFAIEVPVIDVWRIIASYNPHFANWTTTDNTDTEIHVHNLWISVPSSLHGKPLVHMTLRENRMDFPPYEFAYVPSEDFAVAMCGVGGLQPDRSCNDVAVYSSNESGWDQIRVPLALAFTKVPMQNRCYFPEQQKWLDARSSAMLTVCHYLWDHAEAIDIEENGIPVKVIIEEVAAHRKYVNDSRGYSDRSKSVSWRLASLENVVQAGLQASLRSGEGNPDFIEIEDAIDLLEKADGYKDEDRLLRDEDGMNNVVEDWWGRFGPERARWVALDMMVKLLLNLGNHLAFPDSFGALLHSGTGTCFVV